MIRVIVRQREAQPDCWYIDEESDLGVTLGKIGYKTLRQAREVAKKNNPYVKIEIQ